MRLSEQGKRGGLWLGGALLCVGLLPEEATSVLLLGLIIWMWVKQKELGPLRKPIVILFFLLLNGLLMAWRNSAGDVIKDLWYFSLPIITLLAGWFPAGELDSRTTYRTICAASGLYSLYFVVMAIYYITSGSASFGDQYGLRQVAGPGEIISAWGCLMVLAGPLGSGELLRGFKRVIFPVFCINLLAIVLSGSRTSLVLLVLGLFFALIPGWIPRRYRKPYWKFILVIAACVIVFGIFIAPQFADPRTAIGRLANTFRELFNFDFQDASDINQKYRAYESMMGLVAFIGGNFVQYVIGQGFGALVDLQVLQGLGWGSNIVEFQFIPILHNGYLMLLVKTGLTGLLLFLRFIHQLMKICRMQIVKEVERFWASMAMAILVGTVFATFVISGPFGKGTFFTSFIVLGACLRRTISPEFRESRKGAIIE